MSTLPIPVMSKRKRIAYIKKVTTLFGSALVAYWPLSEISGTTALDVSGNGRNAVYDVPSLNNTVSPAGKPAPLFGTAVPSGSVSINNTGQLNGALSSSEGAAAFWIKVPDNYWLNAQEQFFLSLKDASVASNVGIIRNAGAGYNSRFTCTLTIGGSQIVYLNRYTWFHVAVSWSKSNNRQQLWVNGVKALADIATPGVWAATAYHAALTRFCGYNTGYGAAQVWASDLVLVNREITNAEARSLATANVAPKRIAVLGDSITVNNPPWNWSHLVAEQHNGGYAAMGVLLHGVSGQTIEAHLGTQATAAAADDADIIIIQMGVNDDNSHAVQVQAAAEAAIAALKTSNPRASIYFFGPTRKWSDNVGPGEQPKENIRTAIETACANLGVTFWNCYDWLAPSDTVEGVHPTLAGHVKLAAQVLPRLG